MRVLLTGARAPATLELARLVAQAGHEAHVADTDRWHVCRGSRLTAGSHRLPPPRGGRDAYAEAVRSLVSRLGIDVVIPTCEEVFHLAAVRDRIGARVLCEPLERLRPLHDKAQFIDACAAAMVPAPRTLRLETAGSLRELPEGKYILKPRFSRFATRVREWRTSDDVPALVDGAWIAQRLTPGSAFCTWSVATQGRVRAHTTYAVDATAGARGAAIAFHSVRHDAIRFWVETFIGHHRLSGQFAFDFIEGSDGLYGIECNPRLTSGIHCFRDMPEVVAALLAHETTPATALIEPPAGLSFRSRLALAIYGHRHRSGAGLLDAADDPWPRRLQCIAWSHLVLRALFLRTDPRLLSTRDIEWNGE